MMLLQDASRKLYGRRQADRRRGSGVWLAPLAAMLLLASIWAPAAAHALDQPEAEGTRPWDRDPAPEEAARKIAFYERMEYLDRWSQEPTANQLLLDAIYYDLDIALDPPTHTITGELTATFEVNGAQADLLDLDLATTLSVSSVTIGGTPVAYAHANDLLTITLDRTYVQGETLTAVLAYSGTPDGSYGAFGFDSHGGQPMIWTLSEPFGARSWWPCEDWSDDKADSMDIRVTIPAGLIVASNGKLREVTYNGATDTYWWHEGNPIATYLVSLAIHPYTVTTDYYHYSDTDSMEIVFYDYPDHAASNYPENMRVKDMIGYFAGVYGEYPFLDEKYGHAEFNWGGGMEHQTCTSLGAYYESIIAHELAHQWWGDMVTCATFHDIWLNEGFARYSEALWLGDQYGPEGYWGKMNSTRYYGEGTIHVPDLTDWNRIFHTGLTYNKASWVVHMLRGVLGDEDFFTFLLAYRDAFEYGAATTAGLQSVAESVSGLDLSDFFQQWIYEEYYPVYGHSWECVDMGTHWELQLAIDQLQTNTVVFHMPIQMRAELTGGGTFDFTVDNSLAHQEYTIELPAEAEQVLLDPEDWILKIVQEPVVNPTFADGILLVNGVDWNTYGAEIYSAYEDRAFWGDLEISFWDIFSEPSGGYPSTLPAPLGHGRVPSADLGRFSDVIWIGNNYNGDIGAWLNTSILSYLEVGGNVLLMSRQGEEFLYQDLRDYLGITGVIGGRSLWDCVAQHPDLTNIGRIGTQSYCATFNTTLTHATSTLLYVVDQGYNPDEGIGVMRAPDDGGTHNPYGGRFAFLSGRPYRWNHADLATNVETIIETLFLDPSAVEPGGPGATARLSLQLPSPAVAGAQMRFQLPQAEEVALAIFDSQGRRVRLLAEGAYPAGLHQVRWNGLSDRGHQLPGGIYYVRLTAGQEQRNRSLLMVR